MNRSALRNVLLAQAGAGVALVGVLFGGWWMMAHGLSLGDAASELAGGGQPRFGWQSVDKRHWQVVTGSALEDLAVTDAREGNSAGCNAGMVRVSGAAKVGDVESAQDAACTDWISKDFPARCRTFDPAKVAEGVAALPTKAMDFCVDRFEYPNQLGQAPMIVVTFHEAEAACKKGGKRLCTESEWTFACEGEDARPYPNGFDRDTTACVMDRNWRPFAEGALQPRDGKQAEEELDRLWQGEPSGSRGACKSPFGVYDMTGNVDEWTRSVRTTGYASVLKGGYWGPVRARCRPATRAHNEDFVAYQQGFRCCADSNASVAAPKTPLRGAGSRLPGPELPAPKQPVAAVAPISGPITDVPVNGSWDQEDELEAIKKARVGMKCDVGAVGGDGRVAFAGIAIGLAFTGAARRRKR